MHWPALFVFAQIEKVVNIHSRAIIFINPTKWKVFMSEHGDLRIAGLEISDILGIGETGITYRARDNQGRDVVLKVLRWDYTSNDERLQAELTLYRLTELLHPNLVQVLEVGTTEVGKLWYTRPYIQGESFDIVLPQIDTVGAQMLLLQVVDAIDFVHCNGFLHGNIHPENIIVSKGGRTGGQWEVSRPFETPFSVKICDFGAVPPREGLRNGGLLPKDPSERTDIVALGKLVYEAYAGKLEEGLKPDLATIRSHVPEPLTMVVARMLGLSQDEPYRSFQQIALGLSELQPKLSGEISIERLSKNVLVQKDSERRSFLMDLLVDSKTRGHFVIIEGEEGSGKSALVREFASLAQFLGNQVSITSCTSRFSPLEPMIRFISDLEAGLKALNPALLKNYQHVIDRMKGLPDLDAVEIPTATLEFFEGIQSFLTEVSQIQPFVLIVEDMESSSIQMLELLRHLQSGMADTKMLLVTTYAPTKVRGDIQAILESLFGADDLTRIQMAPLDYNGTVSYLRSLLSSPEFPEQIAMHYFESSQGNILKTKELVKLSLVDGSLFINPSGKWSLNERKFVETKKLGETRLIVSKIIESLNSDEIVALKCIAVLGGKSKLVDLEKIFKDTKLFSSTDTKYFSKIIFSLLSKGLLRRRFEAGGSFWALGHGIYLETLLQATQIGSKKDIYDAVYQALRREVEDGCNVEWVTRMAQLALKGSDPVAAFRAVAQAYSACIRQFAFSEARFYLSKLIQMIPDQELKYHQDCVEKLAFCDLGMEASQEALERFERIDTPSLVAKAGKAISAVASKSHKAGVYLREAVPFVDEIHDKMLSGNLILSYLDFLCETDPSAALSFAINRASTTDDVSLKISCLLVVSRLQMAMADFESAETSCADALKLALQSGKSNLQAKVALWQLRLAQARGESDKIARLIRKSVGLIGTSWDIVTKAEYYKLASNFFLQEREIENALSHLRMWACARAKIGTSIDLARAFFNLGATLYEKGLSKDAQMTIEKSRRVAEEVSDLQTVGRALFYTGEHYLSANLADQALISFERAEKLLCDVQDREYLCRVYERLGKMWLFSSELERARKYAKLLKDLVQESPDQLHEAAYLKLSGALAVFQEKYEKAEECNIKALDIYESQRKWRELNLLKIELADIFVRQGEYFRAMSKLSEARLYFEEQNSGKEIKKIRNAELAIDKELGKYGEDYRNLRMLLEISKALSQIGDVDELLPMVVDMAIKVSGAERGFIMLLKPSDKIEFAIGRNQKKENLTKEKFDFSTSVTDKALSERKLVCVTDTATDEKFRAKESIVGLSLRSVMCAPLRVGDEMLGLIYVDSQVPTFYFSRKNAEFFEALCSHAAIALHQTKIHHKSIENARLFEENRASRELEKQKREFLTELFGKISEPIGQVYDILDRITHDAVHTEDLTTLSNQAKSNIIFIKEIIDQSMRPLEERDK